MVTDPLRAAALLATPNVVARRWTRANFSNDFAPGDLRFPTKLSRVSSVPQTKFDPQIQGVRVQKYTIATNRNHLPLGMAGFLSRA